MLRLLCGRYSAEGTETASSTARVSLPRLHHHSTAKLWACPRQMLGMGSSDSLLLCECRTVLAGNRTVLAGNKRDNGNPFLRRGGWPVLEVGDGMASTLYHNRSTLDTRATVPKITPLFLPHRPVACIRSWLRRRVTAGRKSYSTRYHCIGECAKAPQQS